MITIRPVGIGESDAAAALHRRAMALVPDYDISLHSAAEFRTFYRDQVMKTARVWGAFENGRLRGHLALRLGWIDHLYIDPDFRGRGIGSNLVRLAKQEQDELRLYTFQSNAAARAFYESHGFIAEEFSDGQRNEEKMPDMTYLWKASW